VSQPQVVLVLPDRATRLAWEYLFAAAGWRTHAAGTTIDALAIAFNVEADFIVTALADQAGRHLGLDLVRELAADPELNALPCALLVPPGVRLPDLDAPHVTILDDPCDPYWAIAAADAHLGRTTPPGLGRRRPSDDDCGVALHAWCWTLAAADLSRQARQAAREHGDPFRLAEEVGDRLGRRIGADVRAVLGDRPIGTDLADWRPNRAGDGAWTIALAAPGPSDAMWWAVGASEEGLLLAAAECAGAVAVAVRDILAILRRDQPPTIHSRDCA